MAALLREAEVGRSGLWQESRRYLGNISKKGLYIYMCVCVYVVDTLLVSGTRVSLSATCFWSLLRESSGWVDLPVVHALFSESIHIILSV